MGGRFLTAIGLTVLAVAAAPTARADDLAYLNALNNAGIVVYDTSMALTTGYRICNLFSIANGEDVAWQMLSSPDVHDISTARAWVVAAGMTLCPWQYHPESPRLRRAA